MIADHPHTVRTSPVPLYMQGFLGEFGQDDSIDPSTFDPGSTLIDTSSLDVSNPPLVLLPSGSDLNLNPTMFDPTGPLINTVPSVSGNTQDIANMYAGAVASGAITPAQAAAGAAGAINAASKAITPFIFPKTTGPSPRVATSAVPSVASLFTGSSIIKGVPNVAVIGGVLLLALAFASMGRR
jgi:hypothetical protein